jgi:hypothetical protein
MKKVFLGLLLLAGAAALAQSAASPSGQISKTEVQSTTRAAPDGGCDCKLVSGNLGMCLQGVVSLHAVVACTDSSEIDGGSLVSWYCSPAVGQWMPAQTYNNFTVPVVSAQNADGGYRPSVGPELQVTNPFGRFLYATSAVACAGASWDGGISITLEGAQQ